MTTEEVKQLKKDFGRPTELWKTAFERYNSEQLVKGGYTLRMECRSCWYKVFKFHEQNATA